MVWAHGPATQTVGVSGQVPPDMCPPDRRPPDSISPDLQFLNCQHKEMKLK